MATPPQEKCIITLGGGQFEDWERVEVTLEFPGQFRRFSVSISEESPTPTTRAAQQIAPGMQCTVTLAGELIITGYVYERQTVMDATTHAVQITGQSVAGDTTRTSIDTDKLSGKGQFENKSMVEIAEEVLQPYGISVAQKTGDEEGMNAKFKSEQVARGESPFHLLERLARSAAVHIGDTESGMYAFHGVGGGPSGGGGALVEGENIQFMRLVVSDMTLLNQYIVLGQGQADDKTWGRKTAQRELREGGEASRYKPGLWMLERGFSNNNIDAELKRRLLYERAWRAGVQVQGEVGVYGWLKPGGGLWQPGPKELVYVHAPSAMVEESLAARKIVFSQDNARGTMTTIELVTKEFLTGGGVQL
jgi:prophage tail gpP-like protein